MNYEEIYKEILGEQQKDYYDNIMYCCPFHKEKTASFSINKNTGLFNCFGCGVHGNVFIFIKKYYGDGFYFDKLKEFGLANIENDKFFEKIASKKDFINITNKVLLDKISNKLNDKDTNYLYLKRRIFFKEIEKFKLGTTLGAEEVINHNDENYKRLGFFKYIKNNDQKLNAEYKQVDRIIIPVENNVDYYLIGRELPGEGKENLKYKNEMYNKKSKTFFCGDKKNLQEKRYILNEGFIDGIKLNKYTGETIIQTLGNPDKDFIKKLGKKYIYTIFDNDLSGMLFTHRIIDNAFLDYEVSVFLYERLLKRIYLYIKNKFNLNILEEATLIKNTFEYMHFKDIDEFEENVFYFFLLMDKKSIDKEELLKLNKEKILNFKKSIIEQYKLDIYGFELLFNSYENIIKGLFEKMGELFIISDDFLIYSMIVKYITLNIAKKDYIVKHLIETLTNSFDKLSIYGETETEALKQQVSTDFLDIVKAERSESYIYKYIQKYLTILPNGVKEIATFITFGNNFKKFIIDYFQENFKNTDIEEFADTIKTYTKIDIGDINKSDKLEDKEVVMFDKNKLLEDKYFYYFLSKLDYRLFKFLIPGITREQFFQKKDINGNIIFDLEGIINFVEQEDTQIKNFLLRFSIFLNEYIKDIEIEEIKYDVFLNNVINYISENEGKENVSVKYIGFLTKFDQMLSNYKFLLNTFENEE